MCGICGYYSSKAYSSEVIRKMNETLIHRGPDSDGFFEEGNVALAMRRLSIIDLVTGDQPIYNADSSKVIVYNGEVYNFKEIRRELETSGYKFKTNADTEVILLGYDKYNIDIFNKLQGMFAIAIFDRKKKELIVARDRLGIKPLYFYFDTNIFIFASEIKALLKHPACKKEINYDALNNLLKYKYIPDQHTLFNGIEKINPGCYAVIKDNTKAVEQIKFWDIKKYLNEPHIDSYWECKEEVHSTLKNAVKKRLISDVPLGVFLSGGIDSAIITNIVSELSDSKISTFSIGFDSPTYNELKWAKISAEFNGTDHHDLMIKPNDLMQLIENIVYYLDEPIGDYATIPTFYLSKFARGQVKVALSGAGGDETFGGYERYWMNKGEDVIKYIPQQVFEIMNKAINLMPESSNNRSTIRRMKKFLSVAKTSLDKRYDASFLLLQREERLSLINPEIRKQLSSNNEFCLSELFEHEPNGNFVKNASYVDLISILPNDYLVKEDRMSMANSLEVRVPFLDHELVELSFRIKDKFKIKRLKTKYILKDIFKDRIHPEILKRGKYGFEVPMRQWLKKELKDDIDELFSNSYLIKNKIINKNDLDRIIVMHREGIKDNSKLIFTITGIELWYRQHFI